MAFKTWGAKAIAGIGKLPDTTASRTIHLLMKRRLSSEKIMKLRGNRLASLGEQLRTMVAAGLDSLRAIDPFIPDDLGDREGQAWAPLLSMGHWAGGQWPTSAREAAIALSKNMTVPPSYGEMLLTDIRKLSEGKDAISTSNLVFYLGEMEERPWPTRRHDKPINGNMLANMLKEYGIEPGQVWIGGKNNRGYKRKWFEDAWSRYLASPNTPKC